MPADADLDLSQALENVTSSTVKTRKAGLETLNATLRHITSHEGGLDLKTSEFLNLLDPIFQCAIDEHSIATSAKSAITRSNAEDRLSLVAEALRLATEAGVCSMKFKVANAILNHVMQMLLLASGEFCNPLALDYAKCMRIVLGYQPHVEHLNQPISSTNKSNGWNIVANFCNTCVQYVTSSVAEEEDSNVLGASMSVRLSMRSSRSLVRDPAGSQETRTLNRQLAEEMLACLHHLGAAPNAPVLKTAHDLTWTLIDFLRVTPTSARSHQAAFSAMSNILHRTRTEDIGFTQGIVLHVVQAIRRLWPTASSTTREDMLRTLLLLRPYLFRSIDQIDGAGFQSELRSLVQIIQVEYTKDSGREQLALGEIRLEISSITSNRNTVATHLLSLQHSSDHTNRKRTEFNWALVSILATMHHAILWQPSVGTANQLEQQQPTLNPQRPNKRQRVQDGFDDLLSNVTHGQIPGRICALQVLLFLSEQRQFPLPQLSRCIDRLSTTCIEEAGGISSWSLLAVASLASQTSANVPELLDRWATLWQIALRLLPNASSCRAAGYLLVVMLRSELVSQSSINELLQVFTSSMDLNGPVLFADSLGALLTEVMGIARQSNGDSSSKTAASVTNWINRIFIPSRFADKAHISGTNLYRPGDLLGVIYACLGQTPHNQPYVRLSAWEGLAVTYIRCETEHDLIDYLLLPNNDHRGARNRKSAFKASFTTGSAINRVQSPSEALLLSHLVNEITQMNQSWSATTEERVRTTSTDAFSYMCKACCVATCTAFCITCRDTRRQSHLQIQARTLLDSLCDFISSAQCGQDKVDDFLATFSNTFFGLHTCDTASDGHGIHSPFECEKHICQAISVALAKREVTVDKLNDEDHMDLDLIIESQHSRPGKAAAKPAITTYGIDFPFTAAHLRCRALLYCKAISLIVEQDRSTDEETQAASLLAKFIVSQDEEFVLLSSSVIAQLPTLGLLVTSYDTKCLIEKFMEGIVPTYSYERSDLAAGAILDVMSSLTQVWTNRNDPDLFNLGLDTYEWFTGSLLASKVMSPSVQRRLASLLLQLCHVDPDYVHDSDTPSPRTSLFSLLQQGCIGLQFFLASRIPSMFGHFVLSAHDAMFEDLQSSLPADAEWQEGIAMRLLFLSKLASSWHSLLRQCVYYIFETAGRIRYSLPHAVRCTDELATSLSLASPRRLFSIFAPQLLHTWLEGNSLGSIPFAIFQYATLDELLTLNQEEVCAQLAMRSSSDGWDVMSKALRILPSDMARLSFARSLAYAIGCDIAKPQQEGTKSREQSLRDMVGGKEAYKALVTQCFPAVLGYFYLLMQQDDPHDAWLDKRPAYADSRAALAEMRTYSHSSRSLPPSQQPSFRSNYLCDQIERLCRRVGCDPVRPWNPSSFMLAARMLLNNIDESLGSQHACLMIRRLRILIAMAGNVASMGLPLQLLIHSLRPFISDSECADDALGILQYLFEHGKEQLQSNLNFFTGNVILLVLTIQRHSRRQQESTTLESQHRSTIQQMSKFQAWLVDLFSAASRGHKSYGPLIASLGRLRLPGNSHKGSPESALLLFLLQQWRTTNALCSRDDCAEAFAVLAERFESALDPQEDILGDDAASLRYCNQVHDVLRSDNFGDSFVSWGARLLGRAFAASGTTPENLKSQNNVPTTESTGLQPEDATPSASSIAGHLMERLYSRNRKEAGLAEHTLRTIVRSISDPSDALAFEQLLDEQTFAVIQGGTFGYEPSNLAAASPFDLGSGRNALNQALQLSRDSSFEQWVTSLAVAICRVAPKVPIVCSLATILQTIPGLASNLVPCAVHILLARPNGPGSDLKATLSEAITIHLAEADRKYRARQAFFLELLLYLRSQERPGEATRNDRLHWLDVDLSFAATAGARCGMPCAALLFAESMHDPKAISYRSTTRASLSQQHEQPKISNEVLLSIFHQLEEPDSFYGVEQSPSLQSVLERLDYESNGFNSLMFRSAQLDSHMRTKHQLEVSDVGGLIGSLSRLNLNSLTYALVNSAFGESRENSDALVTAATNLRQWDTPLTKTENGPAHVSFNVFQELSRATDLKRVQKTIEGAVICLARKSFDLTGVRSELHSWHRAMATLTETMELISVTSEAQMRAQFESFQHRQTWMHMGKYEDLSPILASRERTFATIGENSALQRATHVSQKQLFCFQAEALLDVAKFAREQTKLQDALTAIASLQKVSTQSEEHGVRIDAAIQGETAFVLWGASEPTASIGILRKLLDTLTFEHQDIPVGKAGLLARLGHQVAEARLEKPEVILDQFLRPAISDLKSRTDGTEVGEVCFEFATFCDNELQNPGNVENFNRVEKLRNRKLEEISELKSCIKNSKKTREREEFERSLRKAAQWFAIDDSEYRRLKQTRDTYVQKSLQNYLMALRASNDHDSSVLRFFTLWLENAENEQAMAVVSKHLPDVPSWKFVLLMNQLMSSLEHVQTPFQNTLRGLLLRICSEHPHHSLHHLFASSRRPEGNDVAARSRYNAAKSIAAEVQHHPTTGSVLKRIFAANKDYDELACSGKVDKGRTKEAVKNFGPALKVATSIPKLTVPPATITVPTRPNGDYEDIPIVVRFSSTFDILSGLSAPKALKATASNGQIYKQLFKSGNDDLRQDAIMEQVFEGASKMLSNHKATRQRDLKVRTYKVIPLSTNSGIIEFVPNSIPINEFLRPAHKKYYPRDWPDSRARDEIRNVSQETTATRVNVFRKVCQNLHPVMRHFFFERFNDPDEWFERRTAYTRTTASVSMLGHILGLGDRHCHNILLDEKTGEVVHIDLGVAFEAGRVLPIPELVPFRLTRDIIDGMGITKTEGVFRRCCEFTMDALREDKNSIITLLNVLRYDPLYNWTVSPLRAKHMQDAQETGREADASSKKKGEETGEADRALSIVEKKLSKTLSTAATVSELIQQATDEANLATLFCGWAAYF